MVDIYEILLDGENKDPIVVADDDGNEISFEQIAVIPRDDRLYCILKPLNKTDGVRDDGAIVFYVEETKERNVLRVEKNGITAMKIFSDYYKLLEEDLRRS